MTILQKIKPEVALKLINFWPPYLGARISVGPLNEDRNRVTVTMKQSLLNTNYVGVHFGGSLYSMCDPFFMFLLMNHLGKDFIVWDKAAHIEFLRPGKGVVRAEFYIPLERIEEIRKEAQAKSKVLPVFELFVTDEEGNNVAKVTKTLYVKKKKPRKELNS